MSVKGNKKKIITKEDFTNKTERTCQKEGKRKEKEIIWGKYGSFQE